MLYEVFSGALMTSCLIAGFFFLNFWKKTQDELFKLFAFSFFLLSFERLVLGYIGGTNEPSPYVYLIRLSAFLLIIFAIVNKNRKAQ